MFCQRQRLTSSSLPHPLHRHRTHCLRFQVLSPPFFWPPVIPRPPLDFFTSIILPNEMMRRSLLALKVQANLKLWKARCVSCRNLDDALTLHNLFLCFPNPIVQRY